MKEILKKIFRSLGYELKKKNPYEFSYQWIKDMNIGSIIDVGANQGQFALEIAKEFPNTPIYSFEPIASIYNESLIKNTKHLNIKTYNVGLGDKCEKAIINHTTYGNATSSLLEMGENHKKNFPLFVNTIEEEIEIITLDSFFETAKLEDNIFLKIDVQGYEDKVLAGAMEALKKIKVVQMETTFIEMYKGEQLFDYFLPLMKSQGFELAGFSAVGFDKEDGRPTYADAIYVKK